MYTYGPLIAKNARSGRLLGGAPVQVTALDGTPLTTAPAGLVTNHEGYLPAFTVDTDQVTVMARPRGGDPLPLHAHEGIQALAATVGSPGEVVETTVTDHNLHPAALDGTAWRAVSTAVSTFSTGEDDGEAFIRSTANAEGTSGSHGVFNNPRPPLTPGAHASAFLTAQVRATGTTKAILQIQFLEGTTSLGFVGNTTEHPVGTDWTTLTLPVTIPPTADNYRITVAAPAPFPAGATVDARRVGLITSDKGWFNGDTPDTTGATEDRTHTWDGAPGASTSTRTITTRTTTGGGLEGRTLIDLTLEHETKIAELEAGGGRESLPLVAPPPAFPGLRRLATPTVRRDGTGYVTDVDAIIDELRPAEGRVYYVSPTGGGDGSGPESPTTFATARDAADVGTIVFLPGEYRRHQSGLATGRTAKAINYLAAGPGVQLTGWNADVAWTLVSGNVYAATRSGTTHLGDPRPEYWADGVLRMYEQTGTTAAEVTAPGTWATDGTTVWAWPLGDTDLAAQPGTLRLGMGVDIGIMHNGGTAYVEGITIEGAGTGRGMNMINGTLITVDCTIQAANDNGITAIDAAVIAVRTDASANGQDGFNYHEISGQCDFIEVDCTARRNGWKKTTTNNGSTAHETVHGIRVGGRYADSHGPILADVTSSRTWTVGATTERTDPDMLPPAGQAGHYHADGAGTTMWVQDADVTGLGTAWRASNGATLALATPRKVATDTTADITGGATLTRY